MSVEHIDVVHKQLPELFATKELPENWDESLIIVPVPDVELITTESLNLPAAPTNLPPENEGVMLDLFGSEYIDVSKSVPSPVCTESGNNTGSRRNPRRRTNSIH